MLKKLAVGCGSVFAISMAVIGLMLLTASKGSERAGVSAASTRSTRCEDVSVQLVNNISTGLKGGTRLEGAQGVKSNDFANVYFISAFIEGPGMSPKSSVGTWASNRLDGSGSIYAVGGYATQFSDWIDGSKTKAEMGLSSDGWHESQDCVKATPK